MKLIHLFEQLDIINNMSEKEQIKLSKKSLENFLAIENPSKNVIAAAIDTWGSMAFLEMIQRYPHHQHDPSVQEVAVQVDGVYIIY